eukprot:CAMPEP_0174734138 /NCGR_PEP_ID=MMETSP1094-20130205/62670_1 /TAXON_ID=156173 /ORGANISM="Chrysochromulina brevifilum, Strain UTEX LB 985" /LENGTH=729 /DNA_ID=CAMNT_0015936903 /DNA_START=39 /DNA_END=2228 /DNA_ORIENTATION=-
MVDSDLSDLELKKRDRIKEVLQRPEVVEIMRQDPSLELSVSGQSQPPERRASAQREANANKLKQMRSSCSKPEDRLAYAMQLKELANKTFMEGNHANALQTYLTGIWMIKDGEAPVTQALTLEAGHAPYGQDVVATFGAGDDTSGAPATQLSATAVEARDQLRNDLHLNSAACLLKLFDYRSARAACDFVLARDAMHPKAVYRMAKAYEGDGDLGAAIKVLKEFITAAPDGVDTSDASKYHRELHRRKKSEKATFNNMFNRTGELYTEGQLREERARLRQQHDPSLEPPEVTEANRVLQGQMPMGSAEVQEMMEAQTKQHVGSMEAGGGDGATVESLSCAPTDEQQRALHVVQEDAKRRAIAAEAMNSISGEDRATMEQMIQEGASEREMTTAYEEFHSRETERVFGRMIPSEKEQWLEAEWSSDKQKMSTLFVQMKAKVDARDERHADEMKLMEKLADAGDNRGLCALLKQMAEDEERNPEERQQFVEMREMLEESAEAEPSQADEIDPDDVDACVEAEMKAEKEAARAQDSAAEQFREQLMSSPPEDRKAMEEAQRLIEAGAAPNVLDKLPTLIEAEKYSVLDPPPPCQPPSKKLSSTFKYVAPKRDLYKDEAAPSPQNRTLPKDEAAPAPKHDRPPLPKGELVDVPGVGKILAPAVGVGGRRMPPTASTGAGATPPPRTGASVGGDQVSLYFGLGVALAITGLAILLGGGSHIEKWVDFSTTATQL